MPPLGSPKLVLKGFVGSFLSFHCMLQIKKSQSGALGDFSKDNINNVN